MEASEMIQAIYTDMQEVKQQIKDLHQELESKTDQIADTLQEEKKLQILSDTDAEDALF